MAAGVPGEVRRLAGFPARLGREVGGRGGRGRGWSWRAGAGGDEQAATEHPDVTFAKVNTDVEQELAGALGIRSIPTLMVFREKVLLFSQPGALSGGQLNELLAKIKEVDMEKVHQEIAAAQDSQDA